MYAIMRTKKHKSISAIARSASHTFRESPTPNALSEQSKNNIVRGAESTRGLLLKLKGLLPTSRRRDAVLCIEYLITASPEAFARHGGMLNDSGSGYFDDAFQWIKERHGAHNVLCAALHVDEKTPHLVIYVTPITQDGRLSARDFLGGPKIMREMQDSFYSHCAIKYGLSRGIKGSKAEHSTIASFYSNITDKTTAPRLRSIDYLAKALGFETSAWGIAQGIARDHARNTRNQIRERKKSLSTAQCLTKANEEIKASREVISQKIKEISLREKELHNAESELIHQQHRLKGALERGARAERLFCSLQSKYDYSPPEPSYNYRPAADSYPD